MLQPPFLKPGDTIGIIAPSRKISPDMLYPCVKLFESWGLKVVQGKNIYAGENQFAGTDEQRRHDLQQMLDDSSVNAIMCARGGYGTIRILDGLQLSGFEANPKWLIGYSDITVLHSYFSVVHDCPTVHAIMPVNYTLGSGETISWKKLRMLLFGELPEYKVETHKFNNQGVAEGKIVGGNLSVLYSLAGTPYDIDMRGAILFLEDLDEYLYHIDRMMMNLKVSGKLAQLSGLIIGGMSDMKDNTIPFGKNAMEIIASYTKDFHYPVMFNFPAGHTEINLPLIFGKKAELRIEKETSFLRYL